MTDRKTFHSNDYDSLRLQDMKSGDYIQSDDLVITGKLSDYKSSDFESLINVDYDDKANTYYTDNNACIYACQHWKEAYIHIHHISQLPVYSEYASPNIFVRLDHISDDEWENIRMCITANYYNLIDQLKEHEKKLNEKFSEEVHRYHNCKKKSIRLIMIHDYSDFTEYNEAGVVNDGSERISLNRMYRYITHKKQELYKAHKSKLQGLLTWQLPYILQKLTPITSIGVCGIISEYCQ
jgi:hypothetical protein